MSVHRQVMDQGFANQITWLSQAPVLARQFGGAHRKNFFIHELVGLQARPASHAIAHANVHLLGHEVHRLVVGIQAYIGVRAGGLEPVDTWQQPFGGKRRADRYGEYPAG
ncbi:hypothetical protein P608_15950 [Comamonas thiooxydans]|uniref:Uncharacterized protein n=1 Tax=Comamonas thiooxydans TaxID=363952 RepID=A0A0E3BVM1_9BURK|nr:hypothetical protein P608_15950 [Comamonas thiooxydans]KGH15677.1 hypothetical protein P607_21275 [Comamonas thiooxydans]